jgi:phosphoribosylglycinamide formyltransferase 1
MSSLSESARCVGPTQNVRPTERLISEPVTPVAGSFNAAAMASGEPGVPMAFSWRGSDYRVKRVIETRKNLRGCRNGSGEQYVNKHFFTVETTSGEVMTLYRTRTGSKKDSWILYTIESARAGESPAARKTLRIAVLVSGGGTNLQALIDAQGGNAERDGGAGDTSADGDYEIVCVIADRECHAIERATKAGIPFGMALAPDGIPRAEARRIISDRALALAKEHGADALVLAGFLTIMGGPVIEEYSARIVNLHPALLPKFGGKGMWGHHVHEAVLASGDAESGCTIHLVDSGCDTGDILLQKRVPVLEGDTAETLAKRISGGEHEAIVEGVRLLAKRLGS